MSQTSIIAASLVIAFVVFITVRGELPSYLAVFTGKAPSPGTGVVPNQGSNAVTLAGGGIDVGLSGAPVRLDFPGYNPGFGQFDGGGSAWWDMIQCFSDPNCQYASW